MGLNGPRQDTHTAAHAVPPHPPPPRAGRALSESSRRIARRLLPDVLALCTCYASVIVDMWRVLYNHDFENHCPQAAADVRVLCTCYEIIDIHR